MQGFNRFLSATVALFMSVLAWSGCAVSPEQDSGGPLLPEQAAYDVTFYDLALDIDPDERAIRGTLTVHAEVQDPIEEFVLDLDRRLEVDSVALPEDALPSEPLPFRREDDQLWIELPQEKQPGDSLQVAVHYGGTPREAPNPPWEGGFTWAETPDGEPWVATSCQTTGADLWWPVKDHPSDEPDSVALHFTVPKPLVAVSNGRLRSVDSTAEARTYHWFASTPINNYGVALNVAPYRTIEARYESAAGDTVPVAFWALPEDEAKARQSLPGFLEQLRFLEELLGPYPFRADKYGIAQTPFLGMEHQTVIAYGHDFTSGGLGYDQGFDALHFHELAHEWFGNLATAKDWKDFWLHEGFATYLEALYAEHLHGDSAYHAVQAHAREQIEGTRPIARQDPASAKEMYHGDVYFKGATVLHALRYLIGEEALREALRRMAYPSAEHRQATDGQQTRLVTTEDFVRIAEEVSGRELDWFFGAYLYQADLPRLVTERANGELRLRWEGPGETPFPMPVDVAVDGNVRRVEMQDGEVTLSVGKEASVAVDPERWILVDHG